MLNVDTETFEEMVKLFEAKGDMLTNFYEMLIEYKEIAKRYEVPDESIPYTAKFINDWFEVMDEVEKLIGDK